MIARGLWIAALVVLAGITAQLQLDRQSARSPEIGALVAKPFRGYVQAQEATRALANKEPEFALAEARLLIERRPVPSEHLTVLAAALVKAGDAQSAVTTVQVAAQRGWRDPVAQEAMARLAINDGDLSEATRRFTALMVLGQNNNELLSDLAEQIFAEPASPGIATLAEIISETERWQQAFLLRAPRIMPTDAFVAVVKASSERGARFDCGLLERVAGTMRRKDSNASDAAEEIAALPCTNRGSLRVNAKRINL